MAWTWPWLRASGNGGARAELKTATPSGFIALHAQGEARWTRRDYATLAREGFMRNPIVHRSVRLIAGAASAVPWLLYEGADEIVEHPLLDLVERPNPRQAGATFLETLYGHLLLAGNAYVELVEAGEGARELHLLRPDRVSVVADQKEIRDVRDVRIATARDKELTLLFDPGASLEERIFAEQFQA